ncbi:MAG TPA: arginine deiminase-related protein [Candidatus Angelobacter sp.]|nr:arginine deiminase-related protein [Candidatus Angelobacter sp.]
MTNINNSILMSDAKNFSTDQPINPYYHHESIDYDKAIQEHTAVRELLIQAGVKVVTVPSPIDCQDGVYTANWALVRGDKAVLASLPNARQNEEAYAEKILTDLGKTVVRLPDGLKFSGQGDALACGNFLFCGSGYRSDSEAQKFVAETLGYERIQLQAVPQCDSAGNAIINQASGWADSFFYDIDMAIAIIKAPTDNQKGLIAYCPEAFMPDSRELLAKFDAVDKITVSIDEAKNDFATNLISTGETVVMSAHAPQLSEELRRHGLTVLTPEIAEIAKGGGFIRCMTLTLD